MLVRLSKLWLAVGLLAGMFTLANVQRTEPVSWARPIGTHPGPVRILQFYAGTGSLMVGQKTQLCYSVENARSVRIAPIMQETYPASSHCVEIGPEHTTHYTIMAEGYDGKVAMKSFTVAVETLPTPPVMQHYAFLSGSPAAPTVAEVERT